MKKNLSSILWLKIFIMAVVGTCETIVCIVAPPEIVNAAPWGNPSFTLPAYEKITLKNGLTV